MKYLILAGLVVPALFAQSAEQSIRSVLDRQVEAWNRGSVRGFMRGYDDSDATLFIGSTVVRGYRGVLERYVARYETGNKMGRLAFSNLEIHPLGADFALVIGNYHLDRSAESGGNSDGIFTLTFQKKPTGWKIIADHTCETTPSPK